DLKDGFYYAEENEDAYMTEFENDNFMLEDDESVDFGNVIEEEEQEEEEEDEEPLQRTFRASLQTQQ
ncbi:hypothetical protein BGX23_006204, partial [Mortierella sp. AD031]